MRGALCVFFAMEGRIIHESTHGMKSQFWE